MHDDVLATLHSYASPEKAIILQRFFKIGKGEYGQGDKFLGITVPTIRQVAKQRKHLSLNELEPLLHSERHEVRMYALLILIEQTKKSEVSEKILQFYLRNTAYINNRDLVDLTAPEIVGRYYFHQDRSHLYQLASSSLLRDRRIAVLATFYFIKQGQYQDTFQLAEFLLHDKHDLMQKAIGRMLREVGKRVDLNLLRGFLDTYVHQMPRTMLRYAIEKLPADERKSYLLR
ncbi:MAG: DNA alkylation repair protein [Candidatus Peribacteria bacterium]|jgi:3-methyladenine DNA glycosylase AlkD|nr:DNA alkylation repair protein [Candidatus Peribacteria bacterium]